MNNEDTLYEGNVQEEKKEKKSSNGWKAAAAAVGGVAAGGVGMAMMGKDSTHAAAAPGASGNTSNEASTHAGNETHAHAGNAVVHEATVGDDSSFGDAFASARAQVGPGGVFEWHGKLYHTYTKEEWNSMSDEQKQAFSDAVKPHLDDLPQDAASARTLETEAPHDAASVSATETGAPHDAASAGTVDTGAPHHDTDIASHATTAADADASISDVKIFNIEQNVFVNGENNEVDIAPIQVDGHQGIMYAPQNEVSVSEVTDNSTNISNTDTDVNIDSNNLTQAVDIDSQVQVVDSYNQFDDSNNQIVDTTDQTQIFDSYNSMDAIDNSMNTDILM